MATFSTRYFPRSTSPRSVVLCAPAVRCARAKLTNATAANADPIINSFQFATGMQSSEWSLADADTSLTILPRRENCRVLGKLGNQRDYRRPPAFQSAH